MANYDNVRLFVINALKQYHAVHSAAEADTIAGILADYPTSAEWDSTNKEIIFKHGATTLSNFTINGANFVKDSMIDSVSIKQYTGEDITSYGASYLYVDFNTDAEAGGAHVDIKIPLKDIFNPDNYYTKSQVDTLIDDSEEVTATALLDINDRINAINSYGYLTAETLGNIDLTAKENVENKKNDLTDASYISSAYYASTYAVVSYVNAAYTYLVDKIIEDEEVTATSITYLHSYIDNLSDLTSAELASIFATS